MFKAIRQTQRITADDDSITTNCATFSIQNAGTVAFTVNDNRSLAAGVGITWPFIDRETEYTQPIKITFASGAGDKLAIIESVKIYRND